MCPNLSLTPTSYNQPVADNVLGHHVKVKVI